MPTTTPDPSAEWWTTSDVAAYLGVQVATVSQYRKRGQTPEPDLTVRRTHLWRPAGIVAWHGSRPRPGVGGRPVSNHATQIPPPAPWPERVPTQGGQSSDNCPAQSLLSARRRKRPANVRLRHLTASHSSRGDQRVSTTASTTAREVHTQPGSGCVSPHRWRIGRRCRVSGPLAEAAVFHPRPAFGRQSRTMIETRAAVRQRYASTRVGPRASGSMESLPRPHR